MSQQINLLNPALRPRTEWLSLHNLVLAGAVLVAVLVAVGGWGKYREGAELARLKSQESQLKATQAQLVELAGLQAQRKTDPALERQVAERKNLLASKTQVLALLEGGSVGHPEGFAASMEALARQVPEGLWLTGFDMESGGRSIRLQGGLLSEPVLPRFVQQLNQEPGFRGRHFSALQVSPVLPLPAPASGDDTRSFLERTGYLQFSLEGSELKADTAAGTSGGDGR